MTLSRYVPFVAVIAVILPQVSAQKIDANNHTPRYNLVDLGTFGGPHSTVGGSQTVVLNNGQVIVGGADTSSEDPFAPLCFDFDYCFVEHTFRWQHGLLQDLGVLPGGSSSVAYAINEPGLIVGWSQNGLIDPITGVPAYVPTVWRSGHIVDLGTFGGAFGVSTAVNDRGFVVGTAENSTPDPFRLADFLNDRNLQAAPNSTELHAFGWLGRNIFDLGTLGGPGAIPLFVNNRGQVAGTSLTSSTPGPTGIPPLDPFLWQNGAMIDLGTLGGTFGVPAKVTNLGQVVGDSDLQGDSTQHGFSWKDGVLTDIGTLGGGFSTAKWVNESGEVAGYATTEDGLIKAFRWKNGRMKDLGTVDSDLCSAAWSINEAGQIVGNSAANCEFAGDKRAFLWEHGRIFDLNAFVPADSPLYLIEADFINERGDITGPAVLPNGDVHQYLLLRCSANDNEGCREAGDSKSRAERNAVSSAHITTTNTIKRIGRDYVSHIRDGLRKVRP